MAMALSDRVREAFKSWDTQGDGTITKRGMQLGPQGSRVTETPKAETSPRESQRFLVLKGAGFDKEDVSVTKALENATF